MKSKKLISFLCAAAMTASAFASLAVTASAADDVVSLDFNDGETTGWTMANGTVSSKSEDGETDKYLELKGGGGGMRSCSYSLSGVSGLNSTTGFVIEFDSSIHGSNGMGRDSQATQIVFAGSNKATDTRSGYEDGKNGEGIGKGFAVKYDARKPFQGDGLVINDPADEIPSDWKALNYVAGVQDKWVRTQAVIKDGKATITMIDRAGNKIIDAQEYACDATDLATIEISCARGDYVDESGTRVEDPGIVDLDNIHIYTGDAKALTTEGLRGEAAKETPIPRPDVFDAAPALIAPSGVTPVVNQSFSTNLARVEVGATGQTIEALDGLQIALGGRADDTSPGDATTYVETADYATGDKVLVMNGGKYSATGRGPVLSAKEKLTHDSENSAVMSFMANITSPAVGGAGRLYILGDTRQAGEDNLGAYNAVMAVLATDDYTYSEGDSSDSLVIKVEPYTWYKVGIVV